MKIVYLDYLKIYLYLVFLSKYNGEISINDLSRKLALPINAINEGIKYLEKENEIEKEQGAEEKDKKQILKYIIILIGATILIFITGNILSDSLETLCNNFGVSQIIIGILLGVITSAPEFITFNEAQKYHKKESKEQLKGVIEATNNLISSNMLNLLVIQSIGILIYLISY